MRGYPPKYVGGGGGWVGAGGGWEGVGATLPLSYEVPRVYFLQLGLHSSLTSIATALNSLNRLLFRSSSLLTN